MKTDQQKRKYLSEYSIPDFTITRTELHFELDAEHTRVYSSLQIRRQGKPEVPLVLDGVELKLCGITIDGVNLTATEYETGAEKLTVYRVPDEFELCCEVEINPAANTRLEGLYLSNGNSAHNVKPKGLDILPIISTGLM